MEQGWTGAGHGANGVSGQNVIRPGAEGAPHPDGSYDSTGTGPVAGWVKLDDKAGEIDANGVGHGHFSQDAGGQSNSAGPWKQT